MNVTLVGFMGTGKTMIGKALAERKKMKFVDVDELIEREKGKSIAEIFAEEGEKKFREIEREAVKKVSAQDGLVISAGGGAVLNPENMRDLKKKGPVVCLTSSPEKIWERVKGLEKRPLLNVPDPEKRIAELLEERAPAYAQADIMVDSNVRLEKAVEETEKAVDAWVKRKGLK